MSSRASISVYIESGAKRVFACAFDWPGWCRAARDEEQAIDTLRTYAPRYAPIAARAGRPLPEPFALRVTERLQGTATTDFGAPGGIPSGDTRPLPEPERERLVGLMQAAWDAFDETVARAPAELRKGPRGGGRDCDRIVEHVLGAAQAYARKIGVKHPQPAFDDVEGIRSLRNAITAACLDPQPPAGANAWPLRYFVRRLAWHSLDHLWEIEDRSAAA